MNKPPAERLGLSWRSIGANLMALFSSSALTQGLTALAILFTARQLGAAIYGQYTASFVLASILRMGCNLGLDAWLLREAGRTPKRLAELTGGVLAFKLAGTLPWMLGMGLLALVLNHDTFPPSVLLLSAAAAWFDGLLNTTLTAFRAALRNKYTLLIEASSDSAWLLGTLGLALAGSRQPAEYMLLRSLTLLISLVAAIWLVQRRLGLRLNWRSARQALQHAPAYALADLLGAVTARLDVTIVALTIGKQATGLYSPAVSIMNALFLVPYSVYLVMVPVLSPLFTAERRRQAWQMGQRFTGLLALLGGALAVLIGLFAAPITSLLGPSYQASTGILQILSPLVFFKSLSYGVTALLVASGQTRRRAPVQALVVVFNAVANLAVVYQAGILGVAWVYVVTEVLLFLGYLWAAWRFGRRADPAEQAASELDGLRWSGWAEKLIHALTLGLALPAWLRWQLTRPANPDHAAPAALERLAARYPRRPKPSGAAQQAGQTRWARRLADLALAHPAAGGRPPLWLEVGCGAGLATRDLRQQGLRAVGMDLSAAGLRAAGNAQLGAFALAEVCGQLPYAANQFDLVFSINAFEHFQAPPAALAELLRVLRPGGVLYLSFDPLYHSPWGLHAARRLGFPYPQLLFSPPLLQAYYALHRAELAETFDASSDRSQLGPYVNGWSLGQFRSLWASHRRQFITLMYVERVTLDGLRFIWRYPAQLKAASPSFADLLVSGIKIVAIKK
jgi:O-antigen/teichoic acid export membrane protein/SAM-dependent methyltransferase